MEMKNNNQNDLLSNNNNKTIEQLKEETNELRKQIRLIKERKHLNSLPTLWINKDNTRIEIHYNNKTILCAITSIDRETSRENSDYMAEGSSYHKIVYNKEEENKRG